MKAGFVIDELLLNCNGKLPFCEQLLRLKEARLIFQFPGKAIVG
jgi:hypothetical protein